MCVKLCIMESIYHSEYFNICTYISKVKLATVVEGNQKAPFSIATTPRYRGGRYSFPLRCTYILVGIISPIQWSSSSSSYANNRDSLESSFSRSPSVPIDHLFGKFLCQHPVSETYWMDIFCRSANSRVSMCLSRLDNVTYEFVLTSQMASSMSSSSYLDGLWDRR